MFQIRRMCFSNRFQSYHKSLAQLCHQELVEQLQHFETFTFQTVVQHG